MVGSGWFIDDVELPEAPQTDERNISRSFQSETLFNFFPNITKQSARAFDYTITGFVYSDIIVFALDQIAKSADTNVVILTIPLGEKVFAPTKYAIKSLVFTRKGPLFINEDFSSGGASLRISKVYPYKLTFTELPDEGEVQEGVDGFLDSNEGALGAQQLMELIEIDPLTALELEDYGPFSLYQTSLGPIAI